MVIFIPKGYPFGNSIFKHKQILPYRIVSGVSTNVINGNWNGWRFDKASAVGKIYGMPFQIDDNVLEMENQYLTILLVANDEPTLPAPKNVNFKLGYSAFNLGEDISPTIILEKQITINAGDFTNKRLLALSFKLTGFFTGKKNYYFNWLIHRDGTDIKDTYLGNIVVYGILFSDV